MRTTAQRPVEHPRVVASARVPRGLSNQPSPSTTTSEKFGRTGVLAYWFVPEVRTRPMRVALAEGGYLGLTLMIGGLAVLLGVYWQRFTDMASASLLAVLTPVFFIAGLAVAGGPHSLFTLRLAPASARSHVAGALFAFGSGSAFGAVYLLAHNHAWFAASAVGLVVAVFGYVLLPTVSSLLAGTVLSIVVAVSLVDELMTPTPLSVGVALVAVGLLLGLLSVVGSIRQADLGLTLGAAVALVGAQQPVAQAQTLGWAYMLSFVVGVTCIGLYLNRPVNALLIVGVLGTAVAVIEATWDLVGGPLGPAAVLIVGGATLIATSGCGLYLWRTRDERAPRKAVALSMKEWR